MENRYTFKYHGIVNIKADTLEQAQLKFWTMVNDVDGFMEIDEMGLAKKKSEE